MDSYPHQIKRWNECDELGLQFSLDDIPALESFGPCSHVRFIPVHYEPNYAYPLIIWLHSTGGDERDLWDVMPHISARNYVSIAPGGFPLDSKRTGWPESADGIAYAQYAVDECIEYVESHFNVSPRRYFLAGIGDGGTMALRIGLLAPEKYAGIISLGGSFPRGHIPLRYLNRVRRMEVLLGEHSPEESAMNSLTDSMRQCHSAGIYATIRYYCCDQGMPTKIFEDMNRWIMERVTSSAPNAVGQEFGR